MTMLAILHDVHDAEWVRHNRHAYRDVCLVTTHAAVDDYLAAHGLASESLSSYLQPEEPLCLYAAAEPCADLLSGLDDELGTALNAAAGVDTSLRFFYSLYRYHGRFEYFNHLKLQTALTRLVERHRPERVALFQMLFRPSAQSYFSTRVDVFELILNNLGMKIDRLVVPASGMVRMRQAVDRIQALSRVGLWTLAHQPERFLSRIRRRQPGDLLVAEWRHPPGLILLLDGLRSANLLPDIGKAGLARIHTLVDKPGATSVGTVLKAPEVVQDRARQARGALEEASSFNPATALKAIMLEDIARRFGSYMLPLRRLHHLSQERSVLGGIWVSPPIEPGPKVLLVEYLLRRGIPVIGRQHGGNYGIEQNYPDHFDSDYRWCTHYLSYGFTLADLKETGPNIDPNCEIIPVGVPHTSAPPLHQRRERIDILFPVSNAKYFQSDNVRPLQHQLAGCQRELLCYLNRLPRGRVVVKPFRNFDADTSAFVELLRDLRHIEVVDYLTFTQYLERYIVGAVLVEFISSPLFETLPLDVEVLALTNTLLPFNSTAETLLRKRVHLFGDLPALQQGIEDFLANRLPRKRDPGFVNRYLLSNGRQRGIEAAQRIMGLR